MELRCERSVMGVMGRRREKGSDERERMSYSTGWRYVGMWRSDLGLKFGDFPARVRMEVPSSIVPPRNHKADGYIAVS